MIAIPKRKEDITIKNPVFVNIEAIYRKMAVNIIET
jgi:hypothetical protein